jgi:hypothetical protein
MIPRKENLLLEWLPPGVVSFLLIMACYQHAKTTPFWQDEIFTHLFVTDSFIHMIQANRDTINANPPLYYILSWIWVRAFGDSEFALRLTSCLPLCISVFFVWKILRIRFDYLPCYIALIPNYLLGVVAFQNKEARFYGLYFLLCVMMLYFYDRFKYLKGRKRINLCCIYLISFMLVMTHYFGVLFGMCILISDLLYCASMVRSKNEKIATHNQGKENCMPLIGVVFASWITLLIVWGQELYRHVTAFKYSWIPRPTLPDLVGHFLMNSRFFQFVVLFIFIIFVLCIIALRRDGVTIRDTVGGIAQDAIMLFSLIIVIMPVVVTYVVSLLRSSIFLDRYLIFCHIGWVYIIALMLHIIFHSFGRFLNNAFSGQDYSRFRVLFFVSLHIFFVLSGFFGIVNVKSRIVRRGSDNAYKVTVNEMEKLDLYESEVPVVISGIIWYERVTFYAGEEKRRFYCVIDKSYFLDTKEWVGFNMHSLHIREAIVRNYGDPNTMEWSEFVAKNPRFAVVTIEERGSPSWVEYRFKNNPEYTVTQYPAPPNNAVVYLVERRVPPPQRKP